MVSSSRILIVGPFPDPITGVSHCNCKIYEFLQAHEGIHVTKHNTSNPEFSESIGSVSFKKILFFLRLNLGVYKIFGKNQVYFTPGQTFFGILKYSGFILVSYVLRKELIIHVHGDYLHRQYNCLKGIKKKIFYFLISKAKKGIVLSQSLKRNLTPFIDESKIFILYNFAEDLLKTDSLLKNYTELRIVFMSNLIAEKGIHEFLDALKILENKRISVEAKIAGQIDPENLDKLHRKINSIEKAEYIGIVKGFQKKELLEWSNVFVLPTYFQMEGQPISILEAMATGNVIISTKHGGIQDILEHDINGYFVKKRSSESIVERIIYLNQNLDQVRKIGMKNIEIYLNNYTFEAFKTQYLKILGNE